MTSQDTTFDTYSAQVTYGYEFLNAKNISIAGATGLPASVAYTFDDDDLVIQAGALSIGRDPSSGYVSSKTLGAVVEQYAYETNFGELSTIQAVAPVAGIRQALFTEELTCDALGRITAKTETLPTGVTTCGYAYDNVGRLTDVTVNGVLARHYGYDGNHNRLSLVRSIGAVQNCRGIGASIQVEVDPLALNDDDLRELIGLFDRYGIDMRQLAQFENESNRIWFRDNKFAYWHSKVFP
jgi:hypothetical protein